MKWKILFSTLLIRRENDTYQCISAGGWDIEWIQYLTFHLWNKRIPFHSISGSILARLVLNIYDVPLSCPGPQLGPISLSGHQQQPRWLPAYYWDYQDTIVIIIVQIHTNYKDYSVFYRPTHKVKVRKVNLHNDCNNFIFLPNKRELIREIFCAMSYFLAGYQDHVLFLIDIII